MQNHLKVHKSHQEERRKQCFTAISRKGGKDIPKVVADFCAIAVRTNSVYVELTRYNLNNSHIRIILFAVFSTHIDVVYLAFVGTFMIGRKGHFINVITYYP